MTSRRRLGRSAFLLVAASASSCSEQGPERRAGADQLAGAAALASLRPQPGAIEGGGAFDAKGARHAFQRVGGALRAEGHAGLFAVVDRAGLAVEWSHGRVGLSATGARCDGEKVEWTPGPPSLGKADAPTSGRAERALGRGLREWVVTGPRGVEQGFDVDLPGCAGIELEVQPLGARATLEGRDVRLRAADGAALEYAGLTAIDAAGRRLAARMDVVDARIVLRVDTHGAQWPVVVDPLVFAQQGHLGPGTTGRSGGAFGQAVAISGTTVAIGAPGEDVGSQATPGAVYVFVPSGGAWSLQQRVVAPDGATNDGFGKSVALVADTLVVGAPAAMVGGNPGQGATYVFARTGATWAQQAKLTPADGAPYDGFGGGLALSSSTLLVGAPVATLAGHPSQGAAYVFARNGSAWQPQQKLLASDGATGDRFGDGVALSGSAALIGAPYAGVNANAGQGVAYVFALSGAVWAQQARLAAPDGAAGDAFGHAVALDGATALVGAPGATVNVNAAQGAGYVFVQSGASWTAQPRLIAADGAANDGFGGSVALAGPSAILGASHASSFGGAVYPFTAGAAGWTPQPRLVVSDGAAGDQLGTSIAIDTGAAGAVVIGAIGGGAAPSTAPHAGAAYVFGQKQSQGASCTAEGDCASGHCVDSVCCDTACGGGACQACSKAKGASADGTCSILPSTVPCRAAIGSCDVAETCDGANPACPADLKLGPASPCRPAAGDCDVAEYCDGVGNDCPTDRKLGAETTCRPSTGTCELAATCDGVQSACPPSPKRPLGTICRAAANDCVAAAKCDGVAAACADGVQTADGTRCTGGLCQAGTCAPPDGGPPVPDDGGADASGGGGSTEGGGCAHGGRAPAKWGIGLLVAIALALGARRRG